MGKGVDLRLLDYKHDTEPQNDTVTLYRTVGAIPCCIYRDLALDDAIAIRSRASGVAP